MIKLRYNPLATKDLIELKEYIANDSEANAVKVVNEIINSCERLETFPEMGILL